MAMTWSSPTPDILFGGCEGQTARSAIGESTCNSALPQRVLNKDDFETANGIRFVGLVPHRQSDVAAMGFIYAHFSQDWNSDLLSQRLPGRTAHEVWNSITRSCFRGGSACGRIFNTCGSQVVTAALRTPQLSAYASYLITRRELLCNKDEQWW